MILLKNVSNQKIPPDEFAQHVSKKSPSDENSFECSESYQCYLRDSNSIFRAAGVNSEEGFRNGRRCSTTCSRPGIGLLEAVSCSGRSCLTSSSLTVTVRRPRQRFAEALLSEKPTKSTPAKGSPRPLPFLADAGVGRQRRHSLRDSCAWDIR